MERMLSKKQAWLKQVRLTKDDDLYVGIDTHKKSLHVALWLNCAPAIDFVMPPDNKKLIDMLNKLRLALRMVVYEAGPTGYSTGKGNAERQSACQRGCAFKDTASGRTRFKNRLPRCPQTR